LERHLIDRFNSDPGAVSKWRWERVPAEKKSKAKRDLLIASTVLIFINLSRVNIDHISLFGVAGVVPASQMIYYLIWAVWGYFLFQHLVLNWEDFASYTAWVYDYAIHDAKRQAMGAAMNFSERPIDLEADVHIVTHITPYSEPVAAPSYSAYVEVVEITNDYMRELLDPKYDTEGDKHWIDFESYKKAGIDVLPPQDCIEAYRSRRLPKLQYLFEVWLPLIIAFVTVLSLLVRLAYTVEPTYTGPTF
jgi:hypothetical protein